MADSGRMEKNHFCKTTCGNDGNRDRRPGTYEIQMNEMVPLIEEILLSGGTAEITVTGNSMYPMLKHRKSQVRLAMPHELRVGDLPLYRRDNGAYILHRIVNITNDRHSNEITYTCCGDHQWHLEKGIRRDQIIAVVTDFQRTERRISCSHPFYCLYYRFWIAIRPLRRLIFGGLRRVKRMVCHK